MSAGIYINFRKESIDAIAFYEEVFQTKHTEMMKFGAIPPSPEFQISEEMKELVLNARLKIHGMEIMISDIPDGSPDPLIVGNNITIIINLDDADLLTSQFNKIATDGHVIMPLGKTFWADKYGYAIDKFGIGWQFSLAH